MGKRGFKSNNKGQMIFKSFRHIDHSTLKLMSDRQVTFLVENKPEFFAELLSDVQDKVSYHLNTDLTMSKMLEADYLRMYVVESLIMSLKREIPKNSDFHKVFNDYKRAFIDMCEEYKNQQNEVSENEQKETE